MSPFVNFSLQRRIGVLVLGGLAASLILFSVLSLQAVNSTVQSMLDERLATARMMAKQVDDTLTYVTAQLQNTAADGDSLFTSDQFLAEAHSLRDTFAKSGIYLAGTVLIDKNGKVMRIEPAGVVFANGDASANSDIQQVLRTGVSNVSDQIVGSLSKEPLVLISVPVYTSDGQISGVLSSAVDVAGSVKDTLSQALIGQTGYAEIVDGNGSVIGRSTPLTPQAAQETRDNPVHFVDLINQGQPMVGTCHRCHEDNGTFQRQKDILAFAPLAATRWGIAIRQSQDEAMAPARQLQTKLINLGIIILVVAIFLMWALVQNVVKPIRTLTKATQKVARGDFAAATPIKRQDEIGELSAAFYNMTQELAKARDELVRLYREAKEKEELRGELFDYATNAREEERKRIARELHDEYGQTLTGLIMSIEALEDAPSTKDAQYKEKLVKAEDIARRALSELRRMTADLRPSALDDLGLVSAIRAYIQSYLETAGIGVTFDYGDFNEEVRLAPTVETTLFRVVQEASHNTVKYAGAHNVVIKL